MFELFLTLIEILSIITFFILIFIYSILSTDSTTTIISFMLYLIILIPFLFLLDYFKNLLDIAMPENKIFFKSIIFFSTIITYIIGFVLFIELTYLLFFS